MIDLQGKDKLYWQIVWTNFRKGDAYAFKEIYNQYVDFLYAYGTKLTPDFDLVKDCIHDLNLIADICPEDKKEIFIKILEGAIKDSRESMRT